VRRKHRDNLPRGLCFTRFVRCDAGVDFDRFGLALHRSKNGKDYLQFFEAVVMIGESLISIFLALKA